LVNERDCVKKPSVINAIFKPQVGKNTDWRGIGAASGAPEYHRFMLC
jgi:hypothetical protein